MIYLLKSPSWKPGYVRYKVGYASDVQRRIQQYEPETYLVGTRPGEVMDEQILHRRLRLLPGVRLLRNEWYIVREGDSCVHTAFHEPKRRIEEEVWRTLEYQSDISKDIYSYLENLGFQSNEVLLKRRSKFNINAILKRYIELSESDDYQSNVRKIFKELSTKRTLSSRLKFLCEIQDDNIPIVVNSMPDSDPVKYFYQALGPERCKANSYSSRRISTEIRVKSFSKEDISKEIYQEFQVGIKISKSEVKRKLGAIYLRLGYNKTPKAVDIKDYFDTKRAIISDATKTKRLEAYKLLRRLL